MYEKNLVDLLSPLVNGEIYPDHTLDNPKFPLILYQQIGGRDYVYVENKLPDHNHARLRITVASNRRLEANNLIRQVAKLLVESNTFPAVEIIGSFNTQSFNELGIYESIQDFGIWYKNVA